jgi:hypothetical protein
MTTGLKTCCKCQAAKQLDAFGCLSSAKDGLTYACLDCTRIKMKEWRASNRERDRFSKNNWAEKNRDKLKEKSKRYYVENKEKHIAACKKWDKKNREKKREYVYKWVNQNRATKYAWNAKRRAMQLNAMPSWLSAIELAQIQEMYDVAVAITTQTGIQHHVDHIHPLQGSGFSGLHVPWNLRVISAFDNLSKNNRLPIEDKYLLWENAQ